MTRVGMHEAKTKLSQLVAAVESGEEVVLERRGVPVARLVAIEKPKRSRAELCGSMKGIWMVDSLDEFNELPDDIAEAFGMR
jgi:prevent-host-death family protein